MSVCVGIPCIRAHLPWLPESLASVAESTLQPAMVVVLLSGVNATAAECRAVRGMVKKHSFRHHVDCVERKVPSGKARNLAAKACKKHAEFISFLDADDLMFPYTLQRMVQLMQAQNASVGYHDYVLKDQPVVVRDDQALRAVADRTSAKWNRHQSSPFHTGGLPTHLGHVTVRSSQWFDQDPKHTREEDARFAREVFLNPKLRVVYTGEKLTRYMARSQPSVPADLPRKTAKVNVGMNKAGGARASPRRSPAGTSSSSRSFQQRRMFGSWTAGEGRSG